jgi:hypothetical protein
MSELLEACIRRTLMKAWMDNKKRRDYTSLALPNWPLTDTIGAPLHYHDLYVAARRECGMVTHAILAKALGAISIWFDAKAAEGEQCFHQFWLVGLTPDTCMLLKFGPAPRTGIMCVLQTTTSPDLGRELEAYVPAAADPISPSLLAAQVQPADLEPLVEQELLKAWDAHQCFTLYGITNKILPNLVKVVPETEDAESDALYRMVASLITGLSHRLFTLSLQSTLGDILSFDLMRLPSGKFLLLERSDEGELTVIALLPAFDPEAMYVALRDNLAESLFDEGSPNGCDAVLLGTYLDSEETYDVESDDFWRQLLGFPYIFEGTPYGPDIKILHQIQKDNIFPDPFGPAMPVYLTMLGKFADEEINDYFDCSQETLDEFGDWYAKAKNKTVPKALAPFVAVKIISDDNDSCVGK